MSDVMIRVENLGKKYMIGHQAEGRSNYVALRDVLADGAKSLVKRFTGRDKGDRRPTQEEFWALKDVSFEVKRGECVGIIGRNGAGKSTLLKILSRITEPTTGRVELHGRVASLLEVGTGFHPELTGRENIYLNGAILGMTRREIKAKFDEIVDFAEVEKFLDTPVKRYSSGMYVRLAFAVAAHLEPEILVVDEVLAVGDAAFQKKCLGKMGEVSEKEGRTVLFVSHNMAAVSAICEKGCLISEGNLISTGEIKTIVDEYLNCTLSSTSIPIIKRQDRKGNGQVRLTSIEISNSNGGSRIFCDDSINILLEYKAEKSFKNMTFAIGIFDLSNVEIYFIDSSSNSLLPTFFPEKGKIKCSLGPINISPGECYVNVAIIKGEVQTSGDIVDYIQNAAIFTIEDKKCYGYQTIPPRSWSMCLVSHQWSSESNGKI